MLSKVYSSEPDTTQCYQYMTGDITSDSPGALKLHDVMNTWQVELQVTGLSWDHKPFAFINAYEFFHSVYHLVRVHAFVPGNTLLRSGETIPP